MSRPTQVSMQDIAKAAGVSPQTVSRVANGSDAVKPEHASVSKLQWNALGIVRIMRPEP